MNHNDLHHNNMLVDEGLEREPALMLVRQTGILGLRVFGSSGSLIRYCQPLQCHGLNSAELKLFQRSGCTRTVEKSRIDISLGRVPRSSVFKDVIEFIDVYSTLS